MSSQHRVNFEPQQDLFGIAAGSADFYNPEGGYAEEVPCVNSPTRCSSRRAAASIAALYGLRPATVEEARARFRI